MGNHQIKPGLGLACVGDGRCADFKIAFGRRQLLSHRDFLRFHKGQTVLAGQHIKIRLAQAHNHVLLRAAQSRLCQIHLLFALLVSRPVGGTVQGLISAHARCLRSEGALRFGIAQLKISARDARVEVGGGIHARLGLLCFGKISVVLRFG